MIRVGVSACLLGERVRYDGGHKRNAVIVDLLGLRFTWVPVCPEMEIGLGAPREPVRLVGDPHAPRMLSISGAHEYTREMADYARRRVQELAALDLAGYVLKGASPSCGLRDVPVWEDAGDASRPGQGLFAAALAAAWPALPIAEEGDLAEPAGREEFVARVLAYARRPRGG
jgi:uncharacterized protein YbbK (DUF523 family)